jgi:hypothetical protein
MRDYTVTYGHGFKVLPDDFRAHASRAAESAVPRDRVVRGGQRLAG